MISDHTEANFDGPTLISRSNNYSYQNNKNSVMRWSNKCDFCGFKCYSGKDLHEHLRTMHESNTIACDFCNLVFLSESKLNYHIKEKHNEAQDLNISPIVQLDGLDLDSFDFDNGGSNTTKRTTNYKLNQSKQTEKIIKDANKSDYDITINNNDQNSTIRCSSGFYLQVGRPCFSSLVNGSVLNASSLTITVDDITKSNDLNGTETNLIIHFSFTNNLQSCGGVRVHLHHSTRTIQIQGSYSMPNNQRAAVWFVNNVVEKRFKDLAKTKKFAIQNANNEINKMRKSSHPSSSENSCQECNLSFKPQSRPIGCEKCKKLLHRTCMKVHNKHCKSSTLAPPTAMPTPSTSLPSSSSLTIAASSSSSALLHTADNLSSHQVTTTVLTTTTTTAAASSSLSSTTVSWLPPLPLSMSNPMPSSSNLPRASPPPIVVNKDIPKKNPKGKQKASPPICQKETTIDFLQNELNAARTRIVQLDADIKDKDQQISVQRAKIKILEDKQNKDILDKYFPRKDPATGSPDPPPSSRSPSHHCGPCSPCIPPPCSFHRPSCLSKHPSNNLVPTIPEDMINKIETISSEVRKLVDAVNNLETKFNNKSKASHIRQTPMFPSSDLHHTQDPVINISHDVSIASVEELMPDVLDSAVDNTLTDPLNSKVLTNHLQ